MIRLTPPAVLLLDTSEPELTDHTNGGLANHVLDLRSALSKANADKAALREWVKGMLHNAPVNGQ